MEEGSGDLSQGCFGGEGGSCALIDEPVTPHSLGGSSSCLCLSSIETDQDCLSDKALVSHSWPLFGISEPDCQVLGDSKCFVLPMVEFGEMGPFRGGEGQFRGKSWCLEKFPSWDFSVHSDADSNSLRLGLWGTQDLGPTGILGRLTGIQFCLGESGQGMLSHCDPFGDMACLLEGYQGFGDSGEADLRTASHFLLATSERFGILIHVFWWGVCGVLDLLGQGLGDSASQCLGESVGDSVESTEFNHCCHSVLRLV